MKRLKIFILIFFVSLSIPLAYFVYRAHQSLNQEELAALQYFADAVLHEMEQELVDLVRSEEARDVKAYATFSNLSKIPKENYILGYFQNNPDGSFQTPLKNERAAFRDDKDKPVKETAQIDEIVKKLAEANALFNTRRSEPETEIEGQADRANPPKDDDYAFADRYLDVSRLKSKETYLGREEKQVQNITAGQARQFAQQERLTAVKQDDGNIRNQDGIAAGEVSETIHQGLPVDNEMAARTESEDMSNRFYERDSGTGSGWGLDADMFQVEVDPMQSVVLNDEKMVLFRRIMINNQVYHQGLVILIKEFMRHLADVHFLNQPMSRFAGFNLSIVSQGKSKIIVQTGAVIQKATFSINRTFGRPFSSIGATLACDKIPRSPGRKILNIMMIIMALVIITGLFAIYKSAQTIVDMSDRRSQFVSSVTHELKTPLTNIRMYIEMLEQGIAADPDREQDYFRILGTESSRLSRLVNNILEFSRLERNRRRMDLSEGTFDDVIEEIRRIMGEKLKQEGFDFTVERAGDNSFLYDRDVMIQVLINLIENSMKFGREEGLKEITLSVVSEGKWMKISLADTGPGILRHALKKIFGEFYRADSELTQKTGGTGIGLALVNKFIKAMGGNVHAKNNDGPGCTIIILLPMAKST
jgi:signal transduction histidine kinase